MSRFFTDISLIDRDAGKLTITGDDVNHIKNVLRAAQGDSLIVSDGNGSDYNVIIDEIQKSSISASIVNAFQNRTEPPVKITLYQGIPKSDKMETIIQKCVELGIYSIVPVLTDRTVVRFKDTRDMDAKTVRWRRVALEAAKQCNRGIIPEVAVPVKLNKAFEAAANYDLSLIPYENETDAGLGKYMTRQGVHSICIFIGPEGGFEESEIERARQNGIKAVTLGPRILRTETAGAAVLSILMYELGDMDK